MRILTITDALPYPPISGDRIRTYNLIRRIAEKHEVWLAALMEPGDEGQGVKHMQDVCKGVEVARVVRRHPLAHVPVLLRYALAGLPLELKFQYSEDLYREIRSLTSKIRFDIVHIAHSHMALYLEALDTDARCGRVLELHNVAFDQYASISRIERNPLRKMRAGINGRMMRRWEPSYAERFDRCVAMSDVDRALLIGANPRLNVDVVPSGVDTKLYQLLSQEGSSPALLFVGTMSYPPCSDAAIYFCQEVLPRIRQVISDAEVWIVGREPPSAVTRLQGDGVHVTGRVEDVIPYYRQSSAVIVPLRAGGGTRLKIMEAMALGRPVVSTSLGCEGIDVVDGQHILIADTPAQFADKTVRLLSDTALRRRLAAHARGLMEERYDWDSIAQELIGVYERALA